MEFQQPQVTIAASPAMGYNPTQLAAAIQAGINSASTGQPQYEVPFVTGQYNASTGLGTIEFTLVPEPNTPYLDMDNPQGSATTGSSAFLVFSGTAPSTNNGLLENYDPDSVQACAAPLIVTAPAGDSDNVQMSVSAQLPGSNSSPGGLITFGYFEQPTLRLR